MVSCWEAGADMPRFASLEEDTATDVLIIGGGLAGILTAYMLAEAGVDSLLVEADRIAGGVTKNTTAKLTSQHGLVYQKLIREFGREGAALYLRANEEALAAYRRLAEGIDCAFEEKTNYIYTLGSDKKVRKELAALKSLGFPAWREDKLPLPFEVSGAVAFPHQAQFHPLRFATVVSRGLNIRENTAVRELIAEKGGITAVTGGGKVRARRVVVTTHFPFINKHGAYFLKMYQHRSYVIAFENGPQLGGMYLDDDEKGLSFRSHGDLLLIGGGSHRTGKQGGGFAELRRFANKYLPNCREKFAWATQDCMTLDSVPYVGRYSRGAENMFVATGFNKWGMTGSMAAARLLADLLTGKPNPYEKLFDPSRTMLRPALAANAAHSVLGLITPTVPRCPHLGCALRWNEAERSWDCPCHGSRFTESGRLIIGPATGGLRIGGRK